MFSRRLHMAVLLGAATVLGCSRQAPPPAVPIATDVPAPAPAITPIAGPATAQVHGLELGNVIGADRRVTRPMSGFSPRDITLHAAVSIGSSNPANAVAGTLVAKWSHLDSGQTVREERKDLLFAGEDVTDFQISKPDGWPTGRYKVEISLDGNVVQTREFEVK